MSTEYNVDIHIKTSGKKQLDALEKQINALKREKIIINVDLDSAVKNIISQVRNAQSKLLDIGMADTAAAADRSGLDNRLKNVNTSLPKPSNTASDSSFLKSAVDAGTGLFNTLTQIVAAEAKVSQTLKSIKSSAFIKNLDRQKALKKSYIFKLV